VSCRRVVLRLLILRGLPEAARTSSENNRGYDWATRSAIAGYPQGGWRQ
jgi:hypothetical protein